MIGPTKYVHENERIKELTSFNILDTLSESDYDELTAIAAEICGTPISLISLVDDKRQWFKSHHGLGVSETPKEFAFCAHAINKPKEVFIVQDARADERFHDNPLVRHDPNVIFYAGVPLLSEKDLPLGTLCVIDNKPRLLSKNQINSLKALSKQVMNLLNLRKKGLELENALTKLEEKNDELERFAVIAAHDLKSPLNNISGLLGLFKETHPNIDDEGKKILAFMEDSSNTLKNLIDGLLEYSRSENIAKEEKTLIDLIDLNTSIKGLFAFDHNCSITLKTELKTIELNKTALEQILINLVSNAIKYNDKPAPEIEIGITQDDTHYHFFVKDNGPGIAPENLDKIFKIFEVLTKADKFGVKGNGLGLATVKKLVESLGGTIIVKSAIGKGASFLFTLSK